MKLVRVILFMVSRKSCLAFSIICVFYILCLNPLILSKIEIFIIMCISCISLISCQSIVLPILNHKTVFTSKAVQKRLECRITWNLYVSIEYFFIINNLSIVFKKYWYHMRVTSSIARCPDSWAQNLKVLLS